MCLTAIAEVIDYGIRPVGKAQQDACIFYGGIRFCHYSICADSCYVASCKVPAEVNKMAGFTYQSAPANSFILQPMGLRQCPRVDSYGNIAGPTYSTEQCPGCNGHWRKPAVKTYCQA